jgi:Fuc2NAc and GlcNAc transferase
VAPTPRGGGLAIVLVVLTALPLLAWGGALAPSSCSALFGAGIMVGAIGWLDDSGGVAARWRLLVHFAAAAWALTWLGGLPPLSVFGGNVQLGFAGDALAVIYVVWLLNLYNFMDGIDGIAGIEAITVCLGAVVLYRLSPDGGDASVITLLVAAAVGGFLLWNFPRARIFMGDVGSGFIGVTFGLLSLMAGAMAQELFWGWVILLGAFLVDATITLTRRLMRGDRVSQAHRSHAYQRMARRLGSHAPISLAVGAMNVVWLLPIAALVVLGRLDGAVGVLLAYAPLVWLALRCGAGQRDSLQWSAGRVPPA